MIIIDEMPTNSRGKADKQELTRNEIPLKEETGRTSETETERRLVELWESVFVINGIKPTDDILDLGVGSLQVMVMCLKVNEIFSIDVPYSQILITPTIEEFSVYIEDVVQNTEGIPAVSTCVNCCWAKAVCVDGSRLQIGMLSSADEVDLFETPGSHSSTYDNPAYPGIC